MLTMMNGAFNNTKYVGSTKAWVMNQLLGNTNALDHHQLVRQIEFFSLYYSSGGYSEIYSHLVGWRWFASSYHFKLGNAFLIPSRIGNFLNENKSPKEKFFLSLLPSINNSMDHLRWSPGRRCLLLLLTVCRFITKLSIQYLWSGW